ncbi:MAG: hypothetical protein HEQ35_21415 [Gloeotrichia echinulata IR180]
MLNIMNYKYLFILALLVNFVGFYPSKGLSTEDSQTTRAELAEKYKNLDVSIDKFIQELEQSTDIKNINSSDQKDKLGEIYNFKGLEEKKINKIQKVIEPISNQVITPAKDGLTEVEIKIIQKQLGIGETGSLDEATKKKIKDFLLQEMKSLKNEIDAARIDLLDKEIDALKRENKNTKSLAFWGLSTGVIALVILILQIFRPEFIPNLIKKNSQRTTESNPSVGSGQEADAGKNPTQLDSSVQSGDSTTKEEGGNTPESSNHVDSSQQEQKTVTESKNHQESKPPASDSPAKPENQERGEHGNQEEKKEEKETSSLGGNLTLLQNPPQSESDLIDRFNSNPKTLSQNPIEVSETSESIDNRRLGYNKPVAVEKVGRNKGIAWVIKIDGSDYLVPKPKLTINEYNYETIESLFNCKNYQSGQSQEFKLLNAAKLVSQGETWELSEKGELSFN